MLTIPEIKKTDLSYTAASHYETDRLLSLINKTLCSSFGGFVEKAVNDVQIQRRVLGYVVEEEVDGGGTIFVRYDSACEYSLCRELHYMFFSEVLAPFDIEYKIWSPYKKLVVDEILKKWGEKADWLYIIKEIYKREGEEFNDFSIVAKE